MKYNIYINQRILADTQLDLVDGAILDYLYFLGNSKNAKVQKEREDGYTWADYSKIAEDNPLLRIKSKSSISVRMKKLEAAGFIKLLEKRRNGHKQVFFLTTPQIDSLFVETNREPVRLDEKPVRLDEPIKTTKDNTTKNSETSSPDKLNVEATTKLIEWAEKRRGQKFMSNKYGAQMKAFKIAKENGITSQELVRRWKLLENNEFWKDKLLDWMSVVNDFHRRK